MPGGLVCLGVLMNVKTKKLIPNETADEVGKVRSTFPEKRSKDEWSDWVKKQLAADSGSWLFVTVSLSNAQRRLASEFASRDLLLGSIVPTTNLVVFVSQWNGVWDKFFLNLTRFELKGARGKQVKFIVCYENDGRRSNPNACPTHSHLLVRVPASESTNGFVRRFCSAFNHYIYPLKVTADSLWIWDVERKGGSTVLNIVNKNDDAIVTYLTKQLTTWGMSDRVYFGGMIDENDKTNER